MKDKILWPKIWWLVGWGLIAFSDTDRLPWDNQRNWQQQPLLIKQK